MNFKGSNYLIENGFEKSIQNYKFPNKEAYGRGERANGTRCPYNEETGSVVQEVGHQYSLLMALTFVAQYRPHLISQNCTDSRMQLLNTTQRVLGQNGLFSKLNIKTGLHPT